MANGDDTFDLTNARSRLSDELNANPDLRRKLMASIDAEVGDQSPEAHQAYAEVVMNRALARGRSLDDTISDPHYYPPTTRNKLGNTFTPDRANELGGYIDNALGGSNIANFATGNQSGNVKSGGAPVLFDPGVGPKRDQFVLENQDYGWTGHSGSMVGTPPKIWTAPSGPVSVGPDVTQPASISDNPEVGAPIGEGAGGIHFDADQDRFDRMPQEWHDHFTKALLHQAGFGPHPGIYKGPHRPIETEEPTEADLANAYMREQGPAQAPSPQGPVPPQEQVEQPQAGGGKAKGPSKPPSGTTPAALGAQAVKPPEPEGDY